MLTDSKALVEAVNHNSGALDTIKGVILLGCPHRGTKIADVARIVAGSLWVLDADREVFCELEWHSSKLDELTRLYLRTTSDRNIATINFVEKRATDISGKRLPFCKVMVCKV